MPPLVCQPAAVKHISAKQTHGCDQYDDQRIHCFYLFPFLASGKCQRHGALLRRQGVKRPRPPAFVPFGTNHRRRRPSHTLHIVYGILRDTTSFAAQGSHSQRTYIRSPVTWEKRPYITADGVSVRCSHRLLAGENALLLTTAVASDGRLSGRGCCKESCPVHRICRMIVRILVRNSQIVNIFGTSSEDALIQKSVLQKFLGDFCSCVKRKKLYTSHE